MNNPIIQQQYAYFVAECLNHIVAPSSIQNTLQKITPIIANANNANACAFIKTNTTTKNSSNIAFWCNSINHIHVEQAFKALNYQNFCLNNGELINTTTILFAENTKDENWKKFFYFYSNILLLPINTISHHWGYLILASKNIIDNDGALQALKTVVTALANTTQELEIKQHLYQRNEVYKTTLATLNEIIWELDLRTKKLKILGSANRIGTFNGEEIEVEYKELLNEIIFEEDKEAAIASFESFLQKPNKYTQKANYRIKSTISNEYVWVQSRQTLLCDEMGKPAMVIGITTDITDSKQVAQELEKHKEQNEFLVQMLQESNEKLNTILNSSKEIILTIDLQTGKIENVNDAIKSLGYTPEEWMGDFYTKWPLEKRKQFHELLKHASESEATVRSHQIVLSNKQQTKLIPFEFSTSLFYFKNKRYLLCVLRDIAERIEFEKNISNVTQQLTHLINNIDDVYAIYNLAESKFDFVSDNVENFFGCSKEEFIKHGLYWNQIMHIEDEASIVKQMQEVIKNKSKGEFFYRITTPFGETKMLLEKITVALDEQGNADKVYIVKSDYTHIENAEQSLIESERKFRFISENITDFISIIDNDGRFVYASPSAEKVIGYTPNELMGEGTIYIIHKDDATKFIEDVLEKAVFEKQESQIRYRILAKTGEYKVVETYFKPIVNSNGQTTSIICSTRDVTEREQLMKDLEQALEKERELNNLRSSFVSTASHQFRTPLTVIQSGVDLMDMYLEDLPNQKQVRFQKQFTKIQAEIVRLQELMNDVLLLGRADARRTPFNPEKRNLIVFCEELIESKYNNRFDESRKVLITIDGKVQDIFFDPKLLDHSLENILSNAYKYSQQGNINMHLNFEYENVTIAITDFGIGIPESDLVNLFQPFYRAGNTTEIEGTGLGLSIVKEFIDKHAGQIFVVSELGKGTTVNIILPINPNN